MPTMLPCSTKQQQYTVVVVVAVVVIVVAVVVAVVVEAYLTYPNLQKDPVV